MSDRAPAAGAEGVPVEQTAAPRRAGVTVFLGAFALALLIRGYLFPGDNHLMEAPPIMNLASGGAEFAADYYVQEMVRFTPRFYYSHLVAGFGRVVGVPLAFFGLWLVAGVSWMAALWRIGRRASGAAAGGALLAGLGICAAGGTLGSVGLWTSYPGEVPSAVPAALALGFVGWGFAFAFERRWGPAYALFGAACMLQFLAGVLPGALFLPAVALQLWHRREGWGPVVVGLAAWAAGAAAVYVPMVVSGSVGSLDADTFFYLYAVFGPPHHILASGWSAVAWVDSAALLVGAWLLWPRREARAVLVGVACAVGLGVVFTELVPLGIFAKLQLASATPWALLIALVAATVAAARGWRRGNRGLAIAFALAPLTPWPGLVLLVLSRAPRTEADSDPSDESSRDVSGQQGAPSDALAPGVPEELGPCQPAAGADQGADHAPARPVRDWVSAEVSRALSTTTPRVGWGGAIVCFVLVAVGMDPLRQLLVFGTLLGVAWAVCGGVRRRALAAWLPAVVALLIVAATAAHVAPPPVSDNVVLFQERHDPLIVLAERVNKRSLPSDVFLVPPFVPDFKLYSRRAVVVDFKCFPYTDRGIQMWSERLAAVYDKPVDPSINWEGDPVTPWAARPAEELLEVAQRYGADYLLTRAEWHPRAPAVLVDQEQGWLLYKLPEGSRRLETR